VTCLALATGLSAAPAPASAATQTWDTPLFGGYDWVVPAGVTSATFELFGASGGGTGGILAVSYPGDGGKTIGTIAVTPGETLKINVGGAPPGGTNGGGYGGASSQDCSVVDLGNQQCLGAGGGGASDVRQGGAALANRVLVAGGGGGAGGHNIDYNGQSGWSPAYGGNGGAGGLLEAGAGGNGDGRRQGATDYPGGCGGAGGTQTAVTVPTGEPNPGPCHQGQGFVYQGGGGGSGYTSLGNGGNGLSNGTNSGSGGIGSGTGGGGGGGYVGGGGGADGYNGGAGGGGGGGSSFAAAAATSVSMLGGVNTGHGKVTVTYGGGVVTHTLSVTNSGNGSGTIASSPAGIDCGATCSAQYADGTQVTLTATPAAGSTFAGYTGGGCGAVSPCTVTLDADKMVDAAFVTTPPPVQRTLTVTPSGTGTGTVTGTGINCGGAGHIDCSETVTDGTQIALTASAAAGSGFSTFSGGGCGAVSPCTVTLDADKTVDARFVRVDPPNPVSKIVCPLLRQVRGTVAAAFDALIAGAPAAQRPALNAARASALAQIDGLLAALGCAPAGKASPTAKAARLAEKAAASSGTAVQIGTPRNDRLLGSAAVNVQLGRRGNDRLSGAGGRDVMLGEGGNDRLAGGRGRDLLFGGSGSDVLSGGPSGADLIVGGGGRDTINAVDSAKDFVTCGAGRDEVSADRSDLVSRDCERVHRN
jgi:List-Bact-rpt repeat protein/hemolysin type calcium-binding protein